jgi:hypothetical protein
MEQEYHGLGEEGRAKFLEMVKEIRQTVRNLGYRSVNTVCLAVCCDEQVKRSPKMKFQIYQIYIVNVSHYNTRVVYWQGLK